MDSCFRKKSRISFAYWCDCFDSYVFLRVLFWLPAPSDFSFKSSEFFSISRCFKKINKIKNWKKEGKVSRIKVISEDKRITQLILQLAILLVFKINFLAQSLNQKWGSREETDFYVYIGLLLNNFKCTLL